MTTLETTTNIGPLGYWLGCYRKYATFSGRARRAEYWWYSLFNAIIYAVVLGAGYLTAGSDGSTPILGVLVGIYLLAVLVPTLAVTSRRLHDAGQSGWWQLLNLVPVGGIVVFIMTVMPGKPGTNQYGPDPR